MFLLLFIHNETFVVLSGRSSLAVLLLLSPIAHERSNSIVTPELPIPSRSSDL